MAVKETGVSYYGISYPEHARRDFQEMIDHNCNAVILALTEFDIDFWFPNIIDIDIVRAKFSLLSGKSTVEEHEAQDVHLKAAVAAALESNEKHMKIEL